MQQPYDLTCPISSTRMLLSMRKAPNSPMLSSSRAMMVLISSCGLLQFSVLKRYRVRVVTREVLNKCFAMSMVLRAPVSLSPSLWGLSRSTSSVTLRPWELPSLGPPPVAIDDQGEMQRDFNRGPGHLEGRPRQRYPKWYPKR